MNQSTSHGIDLLKFKPIRQLINWSGFPYVFQGAMLAVFVYLAVTGWSMQVPEAVNGKLYAKTNLVNLMIWGLWWPMMIWATVLFGRLWCMVCPMELVSNATERLGRFFGVRQAILHSWLRSGYLVLLLYLAIQLLVAGFQIHRVPFYTSLFLWGMLALAALSGFLLKDRAFCRGFCPVALLLSAYGRGGMLAVRAEGDEKCQSCTGKDCVRSCNRSQLDSRSCPTLLNPPKLNSNRDCLVCGQCLKACQPDNMKLLLRRPFDPSDTREPLASWPTTLFIMLASGFVTYELSTEWSKAAEVFLWLPNAITQSFELEPLAGWVKGFWMLLVYPAILWVLMGGIVKCMTPKMSIANIWRRIALPFAVIVAAGHMTKALAKFTSWIGYLPYALKEPSGTQTVQQFTDKVIGSPSPIVSLTFISITGLALMVLGTFYAWKELGYVDPPTHRYFAAPMLVVASLWSFIIFGIAFAP